MCTTVVYNTAQNSSDNLPSYLQTNTIAQMLSIGWQITLWSHMARVSSRSGEACYELLYPVMYFTFLPFTLYFPRAAIKKCRDRGGREKSSQDEKRIASEKK